MINIRVLNAQPWRFIPGDTVFVRGWAADATAFITDQCAGRGLPHYLVVDSKGAEWRIAQIQLSSKPITPEA